MAELRATFVADFSSFQDAVSKAEVSLKSFQSGANKVESALNTMTNSLSGVRIVQQATLAAEAVERIGGVSKLTDAELRKIGGTAQEAVDKLKRLGETVPPGIQKIADAAKLATDKTKDIGNAAEVSAKQTGVLHESFAKLAAAFTAGALIDRAITGLVAFGKQAIDDAGHLVDLAEKTGLSTDALQVYGEVAREAGGSVDDVANAVFKLGVNIEKGEKSIAGQNGALARLKLSYQEIASLKPEEQFETIAQRLSEVTDIQERNRLGVDLFGKTWATVAPAVAEGLQSIKDKTVIVKEDQLKNIDKMADRWDLFMSNTLHRVEGALGSVVAAFDLAIDSSTIEGLKKQITALNAFVESMENLKTQGGGFLPEAFQKQVEDTRTQIASLTLELQSMGRKQIEAARETHLSSEQIAAQEAAAKKAAEAIKKHAEELDGYRVTVIGFDPGDDPWRFHGMAKFALSAQIEIGNLTRVLAVGRAEISKFILPQQLLPSQSRGVTASFFDSVRTDAERAAARVGASWHDVTKQMSSDFQALAQVSGPTWAGISRDIGIAIVNLDAASRESEKFGQSVGIASALLAKNASDAERWGAAIRSATTIAAGAMDVWTASANQGSEAMNTLAGAAAGAKAGAAFGGWGVLIGAATGGMIGWVRSLNDARQAVEEFANRSGGFDALHRQLAALGADGEAMWKKLTQGIKKSDLEGATDEIKKIQGALADLARQAQREFNEAAFFAEQAFKNAADAAKKAAQDELDVQEELRQAIKDYGFTIDELGPKWRQQELDAGAYKLLRTYDLLVASGINVVTVQTRMADSINEYLHNALRTGAEIPEAWKPILESMAKAGQLTDENGEKLTDLSRVSWSQTLGDKFDNLADKLQKLLNKILGIPEELKKIGDTKIPAIVVPVDIEYSIKAPPDLSVAPSNPGKSALPAFAGGTHGTYPDFGAGTPVLLHGRERVMTEAEGRGGNAPVYITVVSQLDGREIARSQVKYLAGTLQSAGI